MVVRETPLSEIHLRNMIQKSSLSDLQGNLSSSEVARPDLVRVTWQEEGFHEMTPGGLRSHLPNEFRETPPCYLQ
jgi:hypothetical protein